MNKYLFSIFAMLLALSACTNEDLVDNRPVATDNTDDTPPALAFSVGAKNNSRATALEDMQLNFGVFGYKTVSSAVEEVMSNYLVGYYGQDAFGKKYGYQPSSDDVKLKSWFYAGLGKNEYSADNSGGDNFFTSSESVNSKQLIRYWDKLATNYEFYGYSPYGADVTCDPASHTMTMITLMHSNESAMQSETMVAYNNVNETNYGEDVSLLFKRLNAKVRIAFYEDIPGYKVRMVNLVEGEKGVGVSAQPADNISEAAAPTRASGGWKKGTITTACRVQCQFYPDRPTEVDFTCEELTDEEKEAANAPEADDYLRFAAPAGSNWSLKGQNYRVIAEQKDADKGGCLAANSTSQSATQYYCVPPSEDTPNSGLTFRLSFQLIAEDNGEIINVKDAGVFVAPEFTQWKSNTVYTYVFKITKDTTGRDPDGGGDVDPTDPNPGERYLYPIVFDNLTVEDLSNFNEVVNEWEVVNNP